MPVDVNPQFPVVDQAVEPIRLLDEQGHLLPGAQPELTDEQVLEALQLMMTARAFDQKCWNLQRQGKLNTFAPIVGQEGAVAGSAMALQPTRDWIVPQYRELPAQIRHGIPLESIVLYRQGHPDGAIIPPGVKAMPYQISLAAQIPHAVGLAWGLKVQEIPGVSVAYFGDGASSEGDFHESCNFAGAMQLPVIFFLQNNQWAISTPRRQQSAVADLAARAQGYGMPGYSVDGNDVLAVHKVMNAAVQRALEGKGPSLIEAHTFRLWAHTTADDPTRYVDEKDIEKWAARDPINRIQNYLKFRDRWGEKAMQEMQAVSTQAVEDALAKAAKYPRPSPQSVYEHVFATPTPALERQQAWYQEV